jgi:DEAD/DEAH box helicase domain-containing protein
MPDEREIESKEDSSESKVKPETIIEKIKIESLKDDIKMENSLLYMKDNSKSKTMDNNIAYDDNAIYYCHPRFKNKPERYFSIRNIEERDVHIINAITQEELEAIETSRLRFYHEHAVFLFKGKSYQVIESDEERKYVLVSPVNLDYITRPANRKIVTINSVNKIIKVNDQLETKYGGVRVQTIIYGYYKLNPYTSKILSREQLPNRSIFQNTYGFWIDIPFDLVSKIGLSEKEMLLYAHGVHAIQHVMLYALPIIILNLNSSMDNLFQMNCSIPKVNSAENLRIMLYEKKGCGVLSETISRHIPYLLAKVLAVIKGCDCDSGCPNCIQTPHCYRKNQDLSKKYAIEILKCLCASFT